MKSTIIASLLFAASAYAGPAPAADQEAEIIHSNFSFQDWVDTLVADPSNALSPEEALAQFSAQAASLSKRQTFGNCQQLGSQPASVSDAVWCINDLASRGRNGQTCNVNSSSKSQCKHGNAQVVTVRGTSTAPTTVNCNDIARAGGLIMDRCTRGDNTVSGEAYIPQGGVAVHIQEPLI